MKYKLIFILILILQSCKNDNEIKHDSNEINLTNVYDDKPLKVNLSTIASDIKYIYLQTLDNSILNRVNPKKGDIKFFSDRILIKDDTNLLLLFDDGGTFINRIGLVGRGPGEYLSINGFTILEDEKLIAVNSGTEKKIYLYDYDGKYVSDFSTKFTSLSLFSMNNHLVTVNDFSFRRYSGYHILNVFSKDGSLKKQLLFKGDEKELSEKLNSRIFWSYKSMNMNDYKLSGRTFFWEHSLYDAKDTIWEISKDFKPIYKATLFFGGAKPKKELFYKNIRLTLEESKKLTSISRFLETEKFMFFEIGRLDRVLKVYRNKEIQKNYNIQYENTFKNRIIFSFFNDIDYGLPFWPENVVSKNKVFKIVYGYEIKQKLMKDRKEGFKNEDEKKLFDMVKDSKITDNPILMVVTLK